MPIMPLMSCAGNELGGRGKLETIYIEDMIIGQKARYGQLVTLEQIQLFADASGDHNPVHLDEEFAATTPFQSRIAHGAMSTAFMSTVLGTKLPGLGTVLLGISNKFKAPVKLGEELIAEVEVAEIDLEKKRVRFECRCYVGDKVVTVGDALVIAPSRGHDG